MLILYCELGVYCVRKGSPVLSRVRSTSHLEGNCASLRLVKEFQRMKADIPAFYLDDKLSHWYHQHRIPW